MKKASEYHQHAEECRVLAKRAANHSHREQLLKMAETWDALAADREARFARRQRINELAAFTLEAVQTGNQASPVAETSKPKPF